jgi:DNA ligase D-like protein (predicted 3'-phosphoesterase)
MAVEDHPIDYAGFEGAIPEKQYGAGMVEVWDKGSYEPEKWSEDEIIVDIHGERLEGKYVLVKTKFSTEANSWLFFKKKPG